MYRALLATVREAIATAGQSFTIQIGPISINPCGKRPPDPPPCTRFVCYRPGRCIVCGILRP